MNIVDYDDWKRIEVMADELGGVKALDEAIKAGAVEVHEVIGEGGAIGLARRVARRTGQSPGSEWVPIKEMAHRLCVDPRTINNRVKNGVMERKLVAGKMGGLRSYVRPVGKEVS